MWFVRNRQSHIESTIFRTYFFVLWQITFILFVWRHERRLKFGILVIYDVINMHEKFQVTSVCHSFTINEGKNIALSGIRTRVCRVAGTDANH